MALGMRMKSDLSGNRSIYDRESRGFIEIG
jgi:hypothetical protein